MPEQAPGQKKCAHPACECLAPPGDKYCSEYCRRAPEIELHCNCKHPGCR